MELTENQKVGLIVGIPAALAAIVVGASVATAKPQGPPPQVCNVGDQQTQLCPDGSTIVIQLCENGEWVPTGIVCPPPSTCESGQKQFKICPDYVTVAEQICQGGQWVPGYQCPSQDIVRYGTPDFFLIDIKNNTLRFQWTTAEGGAASSGYSQGYFINPRSPLNTYYGAGWISQTQYNNALLQLQLLGY